MEETKSYLGILKNQGNMLDSRDETKGKLDLDPETIAAIFRYQVDSIEFYSHPWIGEVIRKTVIKSHNV